MSICYVLQWPSLGTLGESSLNDYFGGMGVRAGLAPLFLVDLGSTAELPLMRCRNTAPLSNYSV